MNVVCGYIANTRRCDVAEPEVKSLAAETGVLANPPVEEQGYGIYLMRVKGEVAVDFDTYAGLQTQMLRIQTLQAGLLAT